MPVNNNKKEHVTGNCIKGYPCYKGAGNYRELCSYICGKPLVGLINDELGLLAEEISKQSILSVAWFLIAAYSKMQRDRNILNTGILSKKRNKYLRIWKILKLPILQKIRKLA